MITIISGSNRANNNTKKVAQAYKKILDSKNVAAQIFALDEHEVIARDKSFEKLEADFLLGIEKFIFVLPEYNGSYPGILKLMIDNTDVGKVWRHKKALLVGVSSGRAGNLRGMEHFTGSLMHMQTTVHPNRLPISLIHTLLNEENVLSHEPTLNMITAQIEEFIKY
jgi:chromate reductase, NAD(P)H dehydrogenase (quinone)